MNDDLASVVGLRRRRIRRELLTGQVLGASPLERPAHHGGMLQFLPDHFDAIYDEQSGLWTIARVIVSGLRLGPEGVRRNGNGQLINCRGELLTRRSQVEYNQVQLQAAPDWVCSTAFRNRPLGAS